MSRVQLNAAPTLAQGSMIVVSGLPGTGKSAVATQLAIRLNGFQISIDHVEDALLGAGLPASWQTGVAAYEAARAAAEQNLSLGRTVVVDAVNDSEPARMTWRRAAAKTDARLAFVLLSLDDESEHRRRLEGRVRGFANVREPTWEQVRARAADYEPWRDRNCIRVDAAPPLEDVVTRVMRELLTAFS